MLGAQVIKRYEPVLRRASERAGVARIDYEDGLVLQALAFSFKELGAVADLGAGVGYSTLWLIAGLADACSGGSCKVYAVEAVTSRASLARRILSEMSSATNVAVEVIEGDAVEFLRSLREESLDLAFVDIGKHEYPVALKVLERKVRKGGAVAFHNAIFPPPPKELFELLSNGPWRYTIVPSSLGILVAVRR